MVHAIHSTHAVLGVKLEELFHEVNTGLSESRNELGDLKGRPLREVLVPVLEGGYSRPGLLVGGTEDSENTEKFIHLRVTREKRTVKKKKRRKENSNG